MLFLADADTASMGGMKVLYKISIILRQSEIDERVGKRISWN